MSESVRELRNGSGWSSGGLHDPIRTAFIGSVMFRNGCHANDYEMVRNMQSTERFFQHWSAVLSKKVSENGDGELRMNHLFSVAYPSWVNGTIEHMNG